MVVGGGGGNGKAQFKTVAPGACQIRGDAFSELEWQYANKKLAEAHERFFEHHATRLNYGKIMLMVDNDDIDEADNTGGADNGGGAEAGAGSGSGSGPSQGTKQATKQVDPGMVKSQASQSANTAHNNQQMNNRGATWYEDRDILYKAEMEWVRTNGTYEEKKGQITKFGDKSKTRSVQDGLMLCKLIFLRLKDEYLVNNESIKLLWVSLCRWWHKRMKAVPENDQTKINLTNRKEKFTHIITWLKVVAKVATSAGYLFHFLTAACLKLQAEAGIDLSGPPLPNEVVLPDELTEALMEPEWPDYKRPPPP